MRPLLVLAVTFLILIRFYPLKIRWKALVLLYKLVLERIKSDQCEENYEGHEIETFTCFGRNFLNIDPILPAQNPLESSRSPLQIGFGADKIGSM